MPPPSSIDVVIDDVHLLLLERRRDCRMLEALERRPSSAGRADDGRRTIVCRTAVGALGLALTGRALVSAMAFGVDTCT